MKKKPLLIGAGMVVVAGVLGGLALRGGGEKPMEVQTTEVSREKIVE